MSIQCNMLRHANNYPSIVLANASIYLTICNVGASTRIDAGYAHVQFRLIDSTSIFALANTIFSD